MAERRTPDFADIMRHIAYIVLAAQRWRDAKGTDDEFRTESVLLEALSLYERDDRLRRDALSAPKASDISGVASTRKEGNDG